jgi:hypothetical protein
MIYKKTTKNNKLNIKFYKVFIKKFKFTCLTPCDRPTPIHVSYLIKLQVTLLQVLVLNYKQKKVITVQKHFF